MATRPSVPPLPTQLSPALSVPESKRRSAPSSNSSRSRRKSRKSGGPNSEVISSLIDSLSSFGFANLDPIPLSKPARGQRASRTAPATPTLRSKRSFGQESTGSNGFSGFSGYHHVIAEDLLDDAAEPPVIRTSKRPSGYSELTSPKKLPPPGLGAYFRNGYARSTSSLTSTRDDNIRSIDVGRRRSITTTSRDSLHSISSTREGHKSGIPQDQARGNVKSANIGRETVLLGPGIPVGISEHLYNPRGSSLPNSPKRAHPFANAIEEEPSILSNFQVFRNSEPSKREGKRPVVELDSSPATGPIVPSRRSSLRHQDLPTPTKNRPISLQSNPSHRNQTVTVAEENEPGPTSVLAALDSDDTEVTKRIRELKAKKELREKEARQSLTPEPQTSAPRPAESGYFSNVPAIPIRMTPEVYEPSHTDNSSSAKSRQGAELGSYYAPSPGPRAGTPVKATQNGNPPAQLASPERPLTPLTPTTLPINYPFVLQSLNRNSPPSSIAASSTRGSTRTTRRKSIAIGGRSAAARAKASKVVEKSESIHSSPFDSESNSINDRQSMDVLEPTNSSKSRRSSSVNAKQRRWSHPELPTVIQRSGSMRIGELLAVRPPETVQEERPSSRDSIDQDVIAFIHAPRLSQKIRHPESGRTIAFSEVGDPHGHAVFCCVGMGLTRYVTAFYDELAITLRLRLITPDRPGVGESQADNHGSPLNWPDDVSAICAALDIKKFSVMAHSAGAIYALATALRMPQHIRGRVHLLAPWIPPSQMAPVGITNQDPPPGAQLPKSQRFLRVLPAPFLKVANTSFMSAASASLQPQTNSPSGKKKRKSFMSRDSKDSKESKESKDSRARNDSPHRRDTSPLQPPGTSHGRRESIMLMDQQNMPDGSAIAAARSHVDLRADYGQSQLQERKFEEDAARREIYDARLTLAIWEKATTNANPAVDLLICLERHQPIGFMYKDITRAVVIHHGSKDTRVPVENVRWLGNAMRRCEVRVLEGQGHGLMAIPSVMGGVLEEVGREWRDWEEAVRKGADSGAATPTTSIPSAGSKWDSMRLRREGGATALAL